MLAARRCLACGKRYEVISFRDGDVRGLDRGDEQPTCPACDGEAFEALVSLGQGVSLGGAGGAGRHYPYFDKALNVWIESAQARREICKRMGVEPAEGGLPSALEKSLAEQERQRDARLAFDKEQDDLLEHHPKMAEYRRLRDRGYYDDLQKREFEKMGIHG